MSQSKFGHFLTGALVGVGLGILLAPQEGSKTRKDLQKSLEELVDSIKNIDLEETKACFFTKVSDLQEELKAIDKEEAIDVIKEKITTIKQKCDDLAKEAKKEALPVVFESTEKIKDAATSLLTEIVNNLENQEVNVEEKKKKQTKKRKK